MTGERKLFFSFERMAVKPVPTLTDVEGQHSAEKTMIMNHGARG